MAELSAGALPMDLSRLTVRLSDGEWATTLGWARTRDATARSFDIDCIRGDCGDDVTMMESGDLVEIAFFVPGPGLAPRTTVALALVPETGSSVSADFTTPATYGTDRVITLR